MVKTIEEVRHHHREHPGLWGLVPTMGSLHSGHLSLFRRARSENEYVAVSIFVNPTQFAVGGDFDRYPRNVNRDLSLIQDEGVELVFVPSVEEMYPAGFQTYVTVEKVAKPLEGAMRPGHFRGVATVVCKLFNIFQPDRAYFGQKDAQQVVVIKQMTRDLALPVHIVVGDTIREPDGLAMSSRNAYLTPTERRAATVLYRALCAAKSKWQNGIREGKNLREDMQAVLANEPLAQVEYVSVADPESLQELEEIKDKVLLSLAVRIGKTRLIDNFVLPSS